MKTVKVINCPHCGLNHYGLWLIDSDTVKCPIKNKIINLNEAPDEQKEEEITIVRGRKKKEEKAAEDAG